MVGEKYRKPYQGYQRKLVISFDIGTTFSGVSYAVLEPGQTPQIHGVTQFPGQEQVGGDSKIPSVVLYDEDGKIVAVGAESDMDVYPELGEIEGSQRAEWFKLHLRPRHLDREQNFTAEDIPPLPPNKSALDVFTDMLAYLFKATKNYICQRQGDDLWNSVVNNIDYVLSHPNGWEGKQQAEMRTATIKAGLVPNESQALKRINFVTEGEASLHFCLNKIPDALNNQGENGIMVVDCGGGTIDTSTYTRVSNFLFKEIAPAECLFHGSIFVTQRAYYFLADFLQGSKFCSPEEIDAMAKYFNRTTKPSFKGPSRNYFIKFGRTYDNDQNYGIKAGSLKMKGSDIANFFEPSIQGIIRVVESQTQKSSKPVKIVFLVGGFATSDYLYNRLEEIFKSRGIKILRPDAYLNKAVAEGCVSFYLDHCVTTRMSKYSYGIEFCPTYNANNAEHKAREGQTLLVNNGDRWVRGGFSTILAKAIEVSEEKEFRSSYRNLFNEQEFASLKTKSLKLKCYRGSEDKAPDWLDLAPGMFPDLCEITADVTEVKKYIVPQHHGQTKFYVLDFDVVLLFGLTELKAHIAWKENGVEKRGPASIVYDAT
ncbi:hypothetical protein AMATHDRAFT_6868 [Amanita thiersii Skay4041]|uniref:Uncharacterized protein n=1 Tax=Amanita thiersii Skay4041 TaxID=703135 RepID=A0A2A9NGD5_9AGAR|nr:hypothetical protein AMATHDRAFT_6868 [Amanita thiersii Skay4041]